MSEEIVMNITDLEAVNLFKMRKLPVNNLIVDFPEAGNSIEIDLKSEEGRFKFIADVNRKGIVDPKRATYQLRYNQVFVLRRLDLGGSHKNPIGPAPVDYLKPFEGYRFLHEDHVHIYLDGWGARWALPLEYFEEIKVTSQDDLYDKMAKFFEYCSIENYQVRKVLFV
jgi:hypothetical protein